MPMDQDKAQQVSDSFNGAQGSSSLQKLYGSAKGAIMQAMKNRMNKGSAPEQEDQGVEQETN